MIILGIDTSCDDTGIAVLEIKNNKFLVLANIISSQVKLHRQYGGVYPMLAKREHQRNLPLVLKKVLTKAAIKKPDSIAVTTGPGLEPCLWQGINFAIDLAKKWQIPIIPINHIEAHLIINFLDKKPKFPAIALIVSGGHTQIVLVEKIGKYKIIGETRDDAAGECFDKTARILGLGYPGGPAIARLAKQKETDANKNDRSYLHQKFLPRPMLHSKDFDFSFSGLKTAVLYNYKSQSAKKRMSSAYKQAMAREIQQAVIDCLIKKTIKAAVSFKTKTIILGGGVSANNELKKQMAAACQKQGFSFFWPNPPLATDNGLMIALAGYFNLSKKTKNYVKIKADGNLRL